MATVYRAKCLVLNRYVAVKVLRDEFTTDNEFIKRFKESVENSEGYERIVERVYNPGDIPADVTLIYTPKEQTNTMPHVDLVLYKLDLSYEDGYFEERKRLGIKSFELKEPNKKVLIESKLHLLSGINEKGEKTGDVFNRYHVVGDFFEIPKCSYEDGYVIEVIGSDLSDWKLEYTYYYV
jgi:serine/threonine protein kinase